MTVIYWSIPGLSRLIQIVKNINDSTGNLAKITEKADKTLNYVTKATGVSVGSAGVAKGTSDLVEAVVCEDNVCAVVSGIGVCADTLSIAASFIPGPNVTTIITVPISVGCKVFVYCCKKSRLPWGSC